MNAPFATRLCARVVQAGGQRRPTHGCQFDTTGGVLAERLPARA